MLQSDHPTSRTALFINWSMFLGLAAMYAWLAPTAAARDTRDFSHLWLAGRMIVTGNADQLYDPEIQVQIHRMSDPAGQGPSIWTERYQILGCLNYPPPGAVLYAAVAWMPLPIAGVVNAYLTLGLALAAALVFSRSINPPLTCSVVGVLILLYYPFFANFALGQNAVLNMACVVAGWYLFNRREDFLAGCVLGLLAYKPNWMCAVAWIPLIHGRWRAVFGMLCGAALVYAGCAALVGLKPFMAYLEQVQKVLNLHELPGYQLDLKYSALGLFRKWFGITTTASVLGWTSAAAVVLITWRFTAGQWKPGTNQFTLLMSSSVLAAVWINPHLNHYDLTLVSVCVVPLFAVQPRWRGADWIWPLLLIAVVYVAVPLDKELGFSRLLPLPSLAHVALWACMLGCLQRRRRSSGLWVGHVK